MSRQEIAKKHARIERELERKRRLLIREKDEADVNSQHFVLIYPLITHEREFYIES